VIIPLLLLAQTGAVQFATRVQPDTVFVGQQVSYEALTLVDDTARAHMPQNPQYTPSQVQGATAYDFPFDMGAVHDSVVNGSRYRVFTYRRAFFPLTPGSYTVPPATLQYTLVAGDGLGTPPSQTTVSSAPATFVAVPLPLSGQPVGFGGAVGVFTDSLWTDGSAARVGDTFTVTVRVAGIGNLNLLPRPTLDADWAAVVPSEERVRWDSTGTVVRGATEFDWVVTPRVAGAMVIPPVEYAYFNPVTRRYATTATAALRVPVAAAGSAAPVATAPPRDTIGDTPLPALLNLARAHALAVIATIVVLVIALVLVLGRRGDDAVDD